MKKITSDNVSQESDLEPEDSAGTEVVREILHGLMGVCVGKAADRNVAE